MARTLHVMAYASAHEEGDLHRMEGTKRGWTVEEYTDDKFYAQSPEKPEPEDRGFRTEVEAWKSIDLGIPRPGQQQDWRDYAGPTSDQAKVAAAELAGQIHSVNGKSTMFLLREAAKCDGLDPDTINELPSSRRGFDSYAQEFGHCLAHQALGSGTDWTDEHAQVKWPKRDVMLPAGASLDDVETVAMRVPHIEFYPDFSRDETPAPLVSLPAAPAPGGISSGQGHEPFSL